MIDLSEWRFRFDPTPEEAQARRIRELYTIPAWLIDLIKNGPTCVVAIEQTKALR